MSEVKVTLATLSDGAVEHSFQQFLGDARSLLMEIDEYNRPVREGPITFTLNVEAQLDQGYLMLSAKCAVKARARTLGNTTTYFQNGEEKTQLRQNQIPLFVSQTVVKEK